MTKLKLVSVRDTRVDEIVRCLTEFVNLKVLKIYFNEDEMEFDDKKLLHSRNQTMVDVMKSLTQLERFHIKYFLIMEEFVPSIFKYATKLELFAALECFSSPLPEIVDRIVQTRKAQNFNHQMRLRLDDGDVAMLTQNVTHFSCNLLFVHYLCIVVPSQMDSSRLENIRLESNGEHIRRKEYSYK